MHKKVNHTVATPQPRDHFLNQFFKNAVHPDASVLLVGGNGEHIPLLRRLLKEKGVKLHKKAGNPSFLLSGKNLQTCQDRVFDVVLFNWSLNAMGSDAVPEILQEAARVCRGYLIIQEDICHDSHLGEWELVLETFGPLQRIILPSNKSLAAPMFFCVDLSAAKAAVPATVQAEPPPPKEGYTLLVESEGRKLSTYEKNRLLTIFGDHPQARAVIEQQPVRSSGVDSSELQALATSIHKLAPPSLIRLLKKQEKLIHPELLKLLDESPPEHPVFEGTFGDPELLKLLDEKQPVFEGEFGEGFTEPAPAPTEPAPAPTEPAPALTEPAPAAQPQPGEGGEMGGEYDDDPPPSLRKQ